MAETIRFARRVSIRVRPDKIDEFLSTMKDKIYPGLSRQQGLRRIYLLRDPATQNAFISVTLWNSKEDADAYESSGAYSSNVGKINQVLEEAAVVTGLAVEYHTVGSSVRDRARARPKGAARKAKKPAARKRR